MKTPISSAASPISQEDLDSLLITAAENPLGEVQDENGLTQDVSELLTLGANVNAVKTSTSSTVLMVAAEKGHTEIVDKLLARGANVNAVKKSTGATALMFAAQKGHTEIVDKLLARGADVKARATDEFTALIVAAQKGHTEIVDKLLARGADVNARATDEFTALIVAAQNGHTEIVDKLLDEGADVNAETAAGVTALIFAAENGHTEIVDKLLARRAAVNAETATGDTALIFAAQNGHTETVDKLLAQGADVNAARPDGVTALLFAAQNGHTEIVDKLLAQGADVNAKTSTGNTALMSAAKNGHTKIALTLLKTLSQTTDEEVRMDDVALAIIITARNAVKEVFATEETKTALLKILSKTTDERVKEGLRPLIKDITVLIPQLKLEAAIESYKTINPDQSVPRPRAISTLLTRFLTEGIDQRGESQQEPIEETLEKIANSTKPVLEAFVQKPNHLKWADEIAKAYLEGCVNQPVRGWLEISAWLPIAQAPETIDKIEASKHLMVLEKMDNYVIEKLAKEAELRRDAGEAVHSTMAGVEVEAGNALFREVYKKLLLNGDISKPWLGVPDSIAYERTITTWLTKKRIEEAYKEAKATLRQKPEEVASYLARSHHSGTWGLVAFPQELEEIDKKYVKKMELLSGNEEAQISLAKEKESAVIKAIIDLSEAPFKSISKGTQAAEEDVTPGGKLSSPSSESLSGNGKEVSKKGRGDKGGSGCAIS